MEDFCNFIKGIDFFGKSPEFYIKGKPKQVTILGRSLTILFIFIYIIIIIYKLYRAFKRVDITFYDTYSNTEEIPSVHITKDNFSLIFAVYNDSSFPFIDESIYYPMAYLYYGEEIKELEITRCNFDKIGSKYKKFFSSSQLTNHYCINNIDFILKPYENAIELHFFPCKNTTENNNHCKPKEIIEEALDYKILKVLIEDILITPINYDNPIKERLNFLDYEIFVNAGEYLYTEMELVRIETSTNIIGFDFFSNPKINEFIKYDNVEIIPYPGIDLDDESNEDPICAFEFQLNDKILLEKRQYTQLIDVLGEVGGFMEIINSFFGLICLFLGDIIYEKTIIKSLFLIDTKKNVISFKKRDISIFKYKDNKNIEEKNIKKQIMSIHNSKKLNNIDDSNEKKIENNSSNKNIIFNPSIKSNEIEINNIDYAKDIFKDNNQNIIKSFNNIDKEYKNRIIVDSDDSSNKVENPNFDDLLSVFCKCCLGKRRKNNNILLNKSMNIITEKLDIINVFRKMCLIDKINKKFKYDLVHYTNS